MRPVRRNPLRPILSAVALVGVFMALGWYSGDQAAAGVDVQMHYEAIHLGNIMPIQVASAATAAYKAVVPAVGPSDELGFVFLKNCVIITSFCEENLDLSRHDGVCGRRAEATACPCQFCTMTCGCQYAGFFYGHRQENIATID